jgi:hypothetical protein
MAENKKSFVLYADIIHTVRKMPKDKAGELFMTILSYVNDENPQVEDITVDCVFEIIKQQLKRDLKKWENFRGKQSENGKKGGRPPKEKPLDENPENPSLLGESQKSLNVNVIVNANDTVNENVINKYIMPSAEFLKIIEQNEDDHMWMEHLMKKFKFDSDYTANKTVNLSFRKHIQETCIDKGIELNFKDFKHVRSAAEAWFTSLTERKQARARREFVS